MTVERITLGQQRAVNEQRQKGRTDRQIEVIVGLPRGILSRPYLVDDSAERQAAADRERCEKSNHWRVPYMGQPIHGWRPQGDCVRSRPNSDPIRQPRPAANPPAQDKQ